MDKFDKFKLEENLIEIERQVFEIEEKKFFFRGSIITSLVGIVATLIIKFSLDPEDPAILKFIVTCLVANAIISYVRLKDLNEKFAIFNMLRTSIEDIINDKAEESEDEPSSNLNDSFTYVHKPIK